MTTREQRIEAAARAMQAAHSPDRYDARERIEAKAALDAALALPPEPSPDLRAWAERFGYDIVCEWIRRARLMDGWNELTWALIEQRQASFERYVAALLDRVGPPPTAPDAGVRAEPAEYVRGYADAIEECARSCDALTGNVLAGDRGNVAALCAERIRRLASAPPSEPAASDALDRVPGVPTTRRVPACEECGEPRDLVGSTSRLCALCAEAAERARAQVAALPAETVAAMLSDEPSAAPLSHEAGMRIADAVRFLGLEQMHSPPSDEDLARVVAKHTAPSTAAPSVAAAIVERLRARATSEQITADRCAEERPAYASAARHASNVLLDVARDTGVSPSTLSRMARGADPDMRTFALLAAWLKADIRPFFVGAHGYASPKASDVQAQRERVLAEVQRLAEMVGGTR